MIAFYQYYNIHKGTLPLCGGELSDLAPDELHCEDLGVLHVADQCKDLEARPGETGPEGNTQCYTLSAARLKTTYFIFVPSKTGQ